MPSQGCVSAWNYSAPAKENLVSLIVRLTPFPELLLHLFQMLPGYQLTYLTSHKRTSSENKKKEPNGIR